MWLDTLADTRASFLELVSSIAHTLLRDTKMQSQPVCWDAAAHYL